MQLKSERNIMQGKMRRTQVAIDCLIELASDVMVDHSTGGVPPE
jgi:hypothetical protein